MCRLEVLEPETAARSAPSPAAVGWEGVLLAGYSKQELEIV